jgi:DNA-binding beta-propeller fold protein YncE
MRTAVSRLLTGVLAAGLAAPAAAGGARAAHLFNLSDFSGTLGYNDGRIVADPRAQEIYVVASNTVRIFNDAGMETYRFGSDADAGLIRDLAIDRTGEILVLSHDVVPTLGPFRLTRCDYRGQPLATIEVGGLPPALASIRPDRMFLVGDDLHLVSRPQKQVAVIDPESGEYVRGIDLVGLLAIPEENRGSADIVGFSVDGSGTMFATVPVLFRAYEISPDGAVSMWGRPGSLPGTFSVVAGIVSDGAGHTFVADRGRGVVMAFDRDHAFLGEFGAAGRDQELLVRPSELAVDGAGRIYISQLRSRGIAAFSLSFE